MFSPTIFIKWPDVINIDNFIRFLPLKSTFLMKIIVCIVPWSRDFSLTLVIFYIPFFFKYFSSVFQQFPRFTFIQSWRQDSRGRPRVGHVGQVRWNSSTPGPGGSAEEYRSYRWKSAGHNFLHTFLFQVFFFCFSAISTIHVHSKLTARFKRQTSGWSRGSGPVELIDPRSGGVCRGVPIVPMEKRRAQ